ncbi:NAD(P)/FAD-dependent oxidoreductase, partial [Corallococcus exiguus]|uniref:NAD(P)/FAD-dependent oxidoreductase n=1 Tax=Corallococcus exiguus TaxID=83462 RepID=UPI00201604E4
MARGVHLIAEDAIAIETNANGVVVKTSGGQPLNESDRLVIAAGVWSRSLAKQVGDHIPLDTERGYNATFAPGSFGVGRPVAYEGEGFVTTPLATGDRVGGAVEFAGLKAEPNHQRTRAMVHRLRHFLPHLDPDLQSKQWMGFRPSIPDSLP